MKFEPAHTAFFVRIGSANQRFFYCVTQMITVKQELERAEERIELVEYRSAERASEIEEGLESYVTKVRAALYAIQAWLHLYLV